MAASQPDDWFTIGWDAWMLGAESAMVIGLRSVTLAMGGAQAQREARRMVMEKVEAGTALGVALAAGTLGASAQSVTRGTVSHYSKMVRANRKRLSNG
jgi:hypothetical protein